MKDEQQFEEENSEEGNGFKAWLEDNLRIILSVLVVLAIAGGIYSYSQRSQAPTITEETETKESIESGEEIAQKTEGDTNTTEESEKKESSDTETPSQKDAAKSDPRDEDAKKPATVKAESRETADTFVETAIRGDGATHLARRALENHLEKNPDSTLSKEHKVYIEDYIRKHINYGHVRVGTSLEFSKSLIQEAIGKSKQLNNRQLENLKKYSERASIR